MRDKGIRVPEGPPSPLLFARIPRFDSIPMLYKLYKSFKWLKTIDSSLIKSILGSILRDCDVVG